MRVGRQHKEKFYLKQDYIAYLQSKNLSPATIKHYTWDLTLFLAWVKKEETHVTKADVLRFLEHLKEKRQVQNITRKNALISLNHYYTFLLKAEQITSNPTALLKIRGTQKRMLYRTYSSEELEQLYDNYYLLFVKKFDERCYASKLGGIPANQRKQSLLSRERNALILSLLVYQGITTKEIDNIRLQDIDLAKAIIKIHGSKKSNERNIPLKASQIGLFMHYLQNIRPQFFAYCDETDKLFFALPASGTNKTKHNHIKEVFKRFSTQLKSIDKNLVNFKHIRASVITQWLKTEGLRKTQYLAGHRHISTTERYLPNQVESLINDIAKYNPF